jgi:hypothetical protein
VKFKSILTLIALGTNKDFVHLISSYILKCGIERYLCPTRNEGQHVVGKEHMV